MAAGGEDVGVQSILPEVAVPDNYQHIQADPEAFGGGVAQGLQKLGAGITQAANTGFDTLHFYNQVAADQASNEYNDRANKLLYGDPNKKTQGPDGALQPDTGYFGLRGKDAMSARQGVSSQLDDLAKEVGSSLSTDDSRLSFETATRRLRFNFDGAIGRYADDQQSVWAKNVAEVEGVTSVRPLAGHPDDPLVIANALKGRIASNLKLAQLQFGHHLTNDQISEATIQAQQAILMLRIGAILPNDPLRARKMLDDNKGLIGSLPAYDGLYNTVSLRARDVTAHSAADAALTSPLPTGAGHATGAPSTDPHFAGQLFVSAPDGVVSYTGPKVPTGEQARAAISAILPGVIFTSGDRTPGANAAAGGADNSMHLRDHATDIRLASLPAGMTEADANQRLRDAGFPVTEFLGKDYALQHGEPPHIHVGWEPKTGGTTPEQTGPDKPVTSLADYYRANFTAIQDQARQRYLALNPNDPEGADRAASLAGTNMHAAITQDEMRIKGDYHALDTAARSPSSNGQLPTTVDQILQIHPELRGSWENLITTNPYAASSFENHLLKANAMPANTTFGTGFYDLYGKVVSGQVKSAADLTAFIDPTKGDGSRLTKEGYNELVDVLGKNGTPQGKADNAMLRNFFNAAHQQINPIQKPELGIYYPPGEAKFNQYLIKAMGDIRAQQAANPNAPLSEILGEKSPVYTARFAGHFVMSPEEQMNARFKGTVYDPGLNAARIKDRALRAAKTPEDLQREYEAGHISLSDRNAEAIRRNWARAVPLKPANAP